MSTYGPQDPPEFGGVLMPLGGNFRINDMTLHAHGGVTVGGYEVRAELWPVWLRIAEQSAAQSASARSANPGRDGGEHFSSALVEELRHAMTAISAAAFTLEAFTASLVDVEPTVKPPQPQNGSRMAAHRFVATAWERAFRLGDANIPGVRKSLKDIFGLRNRAVHLRSEFVTPAMHPAFHVAIDPNFLWFSEGNANAAAESTRTLLSHAARTPRDKYASVVEWAEAQVRLLAGA